MSSSSSSNSHRTAEGELSLDKADWAQLRAKFDRDGYLVFEGTFSFVRAGVCLLSITTHHTTLYIRLSSLSLQASQEDCPASKLTDRCTTHPHARTQRPQATGLPRRARRCARAWRS
jgi:hypothetical protein